MAKITIPSGYQQVMPYLIINNAQGFIEFMKSVFGATEKMKSMRDEETIAHAEVQVGDSTIMFADAVGQFSVQNAGMFIYVADADNTFKTAIENGSSVVMELSDQPYGRSGGILDPFGNTWWVTSAKGE